MAASNRVMERSFAAKLRVTAAALGCSSRKELCQRFQTVNASTVCVLDRLHKWLQERALPRSAQFYDDWAKVVGSNRPGIWFASCSLDALLTELSTLFDADPDLLLRAEVLGKPAVVSPFPSAAGPRPGDPGLMLTGTYACYSFAWSPHFRGKLIRGSLILAQSRKAGLMANYSEFVAGREFRFQGTAAIGAGAVMLPVFDEVSQSHLCLTLLTPRPPVSILCGMMSGVTVLDHEARPSASRLVAVRLPTEEDDGASRGYLPASDGVFTDDLVRCGLPVAPESGIDPSIMTFLNGHAAAQGISQITSAQHSDLVKVFDGMYLAGQNTGSQSSLQSRRATS